MAKVDDFDTGKGRVLSTYAGAILGVDPSRERGDVLRQMVRDHYAAPREFQGNIVTQWQATHEPEALMDFQMITGCEAYPAAFVVHEAMPWLAARPHAFVDSDSILKIRCPFSVRNDADPVFKKAADQPHVMAAMQVEMFVTQRDRALLWQWTPHSNNLEIVEADPFAVAEIVPKLQEFYLEYIDATENAGDHLQEPRVVIDTPRAAQMLAEYDDLLQAIEQAEERKKELLAKMIEMAKGRNALFAGRKLTKVEKKGQVSYAQAIKVLAPNANLEPWRGKPSTSWSLK